SVAEVALDRKGPGARQCGYRGDQAERPAHVADAVEVVLVEHVLHFETHFPGLVGGPIADPGVAEEATGDPAPWAVRGLGEDLRPVGSVEPEHCRARTDIGVV